MVRAPKSQEGYAAIGGGSPLRKITDEQVYMRDRGICSVCLVLFIICIITKQSENAQFHVKGNITMCSKKTQKY